MSKKIFIIIISIFLFVKNTNAQKFFKIEGTKRILTYYNKKRSTQINDSTTVYYYIKNNIFYISVKCLNEPSRPYIKYRILKKIDKVKIKSIGRGSNEIVRERIIDVILLKAESISIDSKFIEKLL
jgi:hypothetical protein